MLPASYLQRDVVCFDLDDTLYPELAFARSGLIAVGHHLQRAHLATATITEAMLKSLEAGTRHTIFNEVLPNFGLSISIIPELVKVYRDHQPQITLHDDVEMLLTQLHETYDLAVITDGPIQTQKNKIHALQLPRLIPYIVYSDQGAGPSTWKPSPWAYLQVQRAHPNAKSLTYIGDNVAKDFVTARQLGWQTIEWVRDDRMYFHRAPSAAHQAHHKTYSIAGLAQLLLR